MNLGLWCRRWDLNPHARKGHYALNVARLPFRHFGTYTIPPCRGVLSLQEVPYLEWWAV